MIVKKLVGVVKGIVVPSNIKDNIKNTIFSSDISFEIKVDAELVGEVVRFYFKEIQALSNEVLLVSAIEWSKEYYHLKKGPLVHFDILNISDIKVIDFIKEEESEVKIKTLSMKFYIKKLDLSEALEVKLQALINNKYVGVVEGIVVEYDSKKSVGVVKGIVVPSTIKYNIKNIIFSSDINCEVIVDGRFVGLLEGIKDSFFIERAVRLKKKEAFNKEAVQFKKLDKEAKEKLKSLLKSRASVMAKEWASVMAKEKEELKLYTEYKEIKSKIKKPKQEAKTKEKFLKNKKN